MIKIGNIEYRNLEEQVLKNKEDIAAHYNIDRVLADFGIRIIGQVSTASDLPDAATFSGDYGDAYAVGVKEPYSFYIWTRADVNSGHPNDYWFDIGQLAIVGPEGPKGDKGEKGDTGTRGNIWISSNSNPDTTTGYIEGDQWLNAVNGSVYILKEINYNKVWEYSGNIRGPQGASGSKGEKGDTGPTGPKGDTGPQGEGAEIVKIAGIITTLSQLPDAESIPQTNAYLQNVDGAWNLWVIVGETGSKQWVNTGTLSVGTLIKKDGRPVISWDIDNVLQGPFGTGNTEGVIFQSFDYDYNPIFELIQASDSVNTFVFGGKTIASRDSNGTTGVIAKSLVNDMKLENVPKGIATTTALRDDQATPRAYVDSQLGFLDKKKLPLPENSIPHVGMLLTIDPDKTVRAIDSFNIESNPIVVDCWVLQRGETRVLPRDRMYLIRGYGDNSVKLRDRVTGDTIISSCTMAIGMVSSSFWPHDPANNKAWAGFLYQTSSLSLSWNGNIRGEVEVENINTGTSGTGYTYIYTLGAKNNV